MKSWKINVNSAWKVPFNFELCGSKFQWFNSLAHLINSPLSDQNWADPYRFLMNSNKSAREYLRVYIGCPRDHISYLCYKYLYSPDPHFSRKVFI